MSLKTCVKTIGALFCVITTGSLLIMTTVMAFIEPDAALSYKDVLKIPLIAILSAIPYLVFLSKRELSRRSLLVRKIVHLAIVASVVFGLLWRFDWIASSNAWITITLFVVLYVIASIIANRRDKKTAEYINAKIREKRNSRP